MSRALLFHLDADSPDEFTWLPNASTWHYVEGYEEAARILLDAAETDAGGSLADRLVFPLVFVCRHAIELRLKELIETGNRCLGTSEEISSFAGGHHLQELWAACRRIIRTAWPGTSASDLDAIEALIAGFQEVDPGSMAFRYPVTKAGRPSLPNLTSFSMRTFVGHVERIVDALSGAEVGLDAEREMQDDYSDEA
jgi:hypothetical protein